MTQAAQHPANRNNDLAAIHIAQKALGMTTEDAQALKLGITGKASAADMTVPQRRMVLAHLSTLQKLHKVGGSPHPNPLPGGEGTGRARRSLDRSAADTHDARWGKARALWALLSDAGVVKANTDAALTAYVLRQTKVQAWRFLNNYQINTVIESLKRWCLREQIALKD